MKQARVEKTKSVRTDFAGMKHWAFSLLVLAVLGGQALQAAQSAGCIVLDEKASDIEQYAAKELQRYLYQLSGSWLEIGSEPEAKKPCFVIGRADRLAAMKPAGAPSWVSVTADNPGPQGYVLKKIAWPGRQVFVIGGSDEIGCLYGVYGLLEDHYGVGFYLGGDVLPDRKSPLALPDVDERKAPAVQIRGFLPWTNFPQSAGVYSWADWRFIIDQAAKMRFNFIHIHNYNESRGGGHNEMFHNFEVGGKLSRVWMPTAGTGHRWSCPGWEVAKYRFGAADLFDDYDFGADCALHNESLQDREVFRKGASLFHRVIAYAHSRGVRIGLGINIDDIPRAFAEAGFKAEDPAVIAARVGQISRDYPDLDYLLCFQSESFGHSAEAYAVWRKIFMGFYEGMKKSSPRTRLALSGWGLNPKSIAEVPGDVICAPISRYSDKCEAGAIYGSREYWGCPWLEKDWGSSQYYYPYKIHLSNTIKSWQGRSPNMKGFYCLTWRVTDAVDAKMWYISKAPWDSANRLSSSEAVYRDYAVRNYGRQAADEITKIIDQNEPFASDFGECQQAPPFKLGRDIYVLNLQSFSFNAKDAKPDKAVPAADFTRQQGVGKGQSKDGVKYVTRIEPGAWVRYDGVDFGDGVEVFEASVASGDPAGGDIELRLDSPDAPVLGTCAVGNTGGWLTWVTLRTPIKPTSGKHDLYLKFLPKTPGSRYAQAVEELETNYAKATEQLAVIDKCITAAESPAFRARLGFLRCRIAAARDHIELIQKFGTYQWADLPGTAESWARNFTHRVTDISSLGNVMSMQNRFIQGFCVAKEDQLRKTQAVKAPSNVVARGTRQGAVIEWKNEEPGTAGFNVYRDGRKINSTPLPTSGEARFTDKGDGDFLYTVTAVAGSGQESPPSVPSRCAAGPADRTPPSIVVISPPTSAVLGQAVSIKARLLEGRDYDCTSAVLFYRRPGEAEWKRAEMTRRVRSVFVAEVPGKELTSAGLEYYIQASDGDNTGVFPASAPEVPLSIVVTASPDTQPPGAPGTLSAKDQTLQWAPASGDVFWYRIYRGATADFQPGPATLLTYVDKGTTSFKDAAPGFDGQPLQGVLYYRVSAVDSAGNESPASSPVDVKYP